jgi:hypothetical protein
MNPAPLPSKVTVTLKDFASAPVARPDHIPPARPGAVFWARRGLEISTAMPKQMQIVLAASFMVVPLFSPT